MINCEKWCVKFGHGFQFAKYFASLDDAKAFAVEVNGALYRPKFCFE